MRSQFDMNLAELFRHEIDSNNQGQATFFLALISLLWCASQFPWATLRSNR